MTMTFYYVPCSIMLSLYSIQEHLAKVKAGRTHYNMLQAACDEVNGVGKVEGIERMHYSFDFAQQVQLPSEPTQPGPIYF